MSENMQGPKEVEGGRILPETRVVSAIIIPFLVAAFIILFLRPQETESLFAWPIGPQMSAMMLGATYLSGVFYFSTVLFARSWQQIKFGLIPVASFAALMGIATLLHWEAFTAGHIATRTWAILYATTPFLIFGIWLRNSRAARLRESEAGELTLPIPIKLAVGIVGVFGLIVSLLLFIIPSVMIELWPWRLSPLTARVIAAQFVVFSVFSLAAFLDPRWQSLRLVIRSELAAPAFFLIAMIASRDNFDWTNPLAWVFAFNVAIVFTIGVPAMYLLMEARRKRRNRRP